MIPHVMEFDDPELTSALLEALETGQTLIFPTETVYGIGGNPWDESVLQHVRSLKARSPHQPFTLHLAGIGDIERHAQLDKTSQAIIEQLLPGPYTLLLPATSDAPPSSVLDGVVGIRVPEHPFFCDTLGSLGRPLFGTSVNRSGERPLSEISQIIEHFSNADLIIVGPVRGTESAILDLTSAPIRIVRGSLPDDLRVD